jgi:sugar lactone lactonase YvrE
VVGTLSLEDEKETATEVLLRVSPSGLIETLRSGIGMSNGLGFSPNGDTIFHIDTLAGTLSSHSYTSGPFDHSEPWHTVVSDFAHFADGMTVDAAGDLWVAQWGGARICHFAPDGSYIDDIQVSATQPTCAGFVGQGLNRLAITSARKGLETPPDDSGALFLADVGERGLPEYRWAGSTARPYWENEL